MMRCLLVNITRNRRGQPIRDARIVTGETLSIGRGSDSSIYLPHPRVNLHHATIRVRDDGRLIIEGNHTQIGVNGAFTQSAHLRPGTRISVGPYELEVELGGAEGAPEHDFALTLELRDDARPASVRRRPTSLAAAGWSKRRLSFLCAIVVALFFLAWPLLHATHREVREAGAAAPVAATESWSAGPLAAGHRGFGSDCQSCHTVPFQPVSDTACRACHMGTGDHVRDASLQKVVFGTTRCAQCHRDHRGLAGMNDIDPRLCGDCHGRLRSRDVKTALPDIHDFATDHPPFRVTVLTDAALGRSERIVQDSPNLRQATGLKFPHSVHLDARGVASPAATTASGRVRLGCADCHVAEASGVGFRPVRMEEHCASCHRLEFEPDVTSRQVPHGDAARVVLMLREFYASEALGTTPIEISTERDNVLRIPEAAAPEVKRRDASAWANQRARAAAIDLFEVRVCVACHEVERTSPANAVLPSFHIGAVQLADRYLPHARFEHARHAAVECTSCHAVTQSKSSSDVAMPDIARCRDCHGGSQPVAKKVTSNCELCHGFHQHPELEHAPAAAHVKSAQALDPSLDLSFEESPHRSIEPAHATLPPPSTEPAS